MKRNIMICSALCSAFLFHPGSAKASPTYPGVIQQELDMPCPPRCTLCHEDREGGLGTIRPRSFGDALVGSVGLRAADESRLRCGLRLLDPNCEDPPSCAEAGQQCSPADTDGDEVTDIAELREASDPNVPGEGNLCGAGYGCSARIAPEPPPRAALWLAGVIAALTAVSLMRRRERRRGS